MAERICLLNGENEVQEYDVNQWFSENLSTGVLVSNHLEITPQDPADNTVDISAGVVLIEVERTVDTKTFKVFCENTSEKVVTITGTNGNVGSVIAAIPKANVQDGNANPQDGTGVFTIIHVEGVDANPMDDSEIDSQTADAYFWYRLADVVQGATVEEGDITDSRNTISINNIDTLQVDNIVEKTTDNGIDIDTLKIVDGLIDQPENGITPPTPTTGRWRLYPKADGYYVLDDNGVETKIAVGGVSLSEKSQAAAAAGEIFESTETRTLSVKHIDGGVVNYGVGGVYGEAITAGDPVGYLKMVDLGANQYEPTNDTYVNGSSGATNYNGEIYIYTDNGDPRYGMFQFTSLLSDIGVTAADVKQIVSFDFNIYRGTSSGAGDHDLRPINESWTSATVTYDTAPDHSSLAMSNVVAGNATGYITFNCDDLRYGESYRLINYGFILKCANATEHRWNSKNNGSNKPYIDNLVYIGMDGKLYKVDSSNGIFANGFIGFASATGVLNDEHPVIGGNDTLYDSGAPFVAGKAYFLHSNGTLLSSPSSNLCEVGNAITTTKLLVRKGPCFLAATEARGPDSIPGSITFQVPEDANMVVVKLSTPQESSYSIRGSATLMKWGTTQISTYHSGGSGTASITFSTSVSISFSGSGSPAGGSVNCTFYRI
jgi:hypothetical protein